MSELTHRDTNGIREWKRVCPECHSDIWVKSKSLLKSNHLCKSCGYKKLSERNRMVVNASDLIRRCPDCNVEMTYKTIWTKRAADKHCATCKSCQNKRLSDMNTGKSPSTKTRAKLSTAMMGRVFSDESKMKMSRRAKESFANGRRRPVGETNPMFGVSRFGPSNPNYGRKWTDERKAAQRERSIQKRRYGLINYNKVACDFIDKLNEERGWNLRHALNGGEFRHKGFFADGYDAERNIWFEYDEPHHYHSNGKLKQKDIDRMNRIVSDLGCEFWRYNERDKNYASTKK